MTERHLCAGNVQQTPSSFSHRYRQNICMTFWSSPSFLGPMNVCLWAHRSEGFLNGIFHPCALLVRGLTRLESCWQTAVVAVGVTWKFRLTLWPGNYIWSFQIGFWLMQIIWELSEFRYRGSNQNFELDLSIWVIWPGEANLEKCRFSMYFPHWHIHFLCMF